MIIFNLQGILDSYNIDPSKKKVFEIENSSEMQQIQKQMGQITGGTTVPRVFIGGQFVGGCDEVSSLHSQGRLEGILASAGALG